MQVHITTQLVLVWAGVIGIGSYLAANAPVIPPRRFIILAGLMGLLVSLGIGGAWRTPHLGWLFGSGSGSMPEGQLNWIKAWVAIGAAGLSMYEGYRIKVKKRVAPHYVKGITAFVALISIGCYYRFGDLGYSNFYHRWEFYHYYLGAKYNRELGYERLYACTAVAQADLGQLNEVRSRKLRDLTQDALAPAEDALKNAADCRDRFTAERWEAYKKDVNWFRHSSNIQYWNDMQKDHGYNPPPVWTVMGHALASLAPAGDRFFKLLGLIDPLYFAGLFTAVWWAFGWRVLTVALVFWGCQLPAEYFWTGGAFLRQDWLFWLVLSACLIRKRFFMLGGAAFAYSTMLRVFPGLIAIGWGLQMAAHFLKHKRFAPEHLRLVAGGAIASVVLVGVSVGVSGVDSYPEFYHHIQVHNHTPLTNNMGLPTLLEHSWKGRMEFARDEKLVDPFGPWKQMRLDRLHALLPLRAALMLGLAAAFFYIVRRIRSLWIVQSLSLVWVVSLLELTCYYFTIFILAAFLSRFRKGLEQALICAAAVSQLFVINHWLSYYYDDRYTAQAVVFVVFAFALLFAYWPARRRPAVQKSKDEPGTGRLPADPPRTAPQT